MTHLFFGSGVRHDRVRATRVPDAAKRRERPDAGQARSPRRVGRAFAVLVAAGLLLLPVPSAAVGAGAPAPIPSPPRPTLLVSPLAHGVVPAGGVLASTIEITNPTDTALPAASATVALGASPLRSRAELEDWIERGVLADGAEVVDRPAVPEVPASGSSLAASMVDAGALAGRAAGIYALSASYARELVSRSVVVLTDPVDQPGDPGARSVAVVVAITSGPQSEGLLDADQLTALTGEDGRLTALLSGVAGTPAIMAVDPAILASIRVLGDSAPPSALEWLDQLASVPNERFALQFGDADVSAQLNAGLPSLLAPTSLTYATSPEDFPARTQTSQPTPTAPSGAAGSADESTPGDEEQEESGEPTLAQLLAVTGAQETVYWPAAGRADAGAIGALAQQTTATGITGHVLLSSDAVTRSERRATAQTLEESSLLVYEAGASSAIRETASAPEGAVQSRTALISAQLALERAGASGPLLVSTERLDELTGPALRAALDTVYGFPGTVPATLTTLLAAAPTAAATTAEPDQEAAEVVLRLLAGEAELAEFSSIIDEPSLLTSPERSAILQLIGAGWHDQPALWRDAISTHAAGIRATLTSVAIQEPSTVQLVSPESVLPFFVRNDLPFAANVVLVAAPDNLRLDVERTQNVRAQPGVNTRVEVPVRARVGSGEVTVELRLLSPTSEQVGPIQRAQVTVRAEWERIGIVILGALVVVLLGAGLLRTVQRRRRGATT